MPEGWGLRAAHVMSVKYDNQRRLTVGELARAIERGAIRTAVRGRNYEISWREVHRLRLGLPADETRLLLHTGSGEQIGPGDEDVSQAI
jgi:hypothetical protein